MSDTPIVFFSTYEPEDYDLYRGGLLEGRVRLDPYSAETVGPRPDWGPSKSRSNYFQFNLHSLRWVYDLIRPGQAGDLTALDRAAEIWDYWESCNPQGRSTTPHAWHDEHTVSWRAITLAYLYRVWTASAMPADGRPARWRALARQHGEFMAREANYRPFHNHGINNALGLLALGSAFAGELPQATEWVALSRIRAEQQLHDNVSSAGLHLEQSAFYHCYVLRTLLEIDRVTVAIGRPLSAAFGKRLDRMLDMTARIAGDHAVASCFPYSNPTKDPLRVYPLAGLASVPQHLQGSGAERFRRAIDAPPSRDLTVDDEGGYAVFQGGSDEVSVVFHTRILDVPHGHQDVLGVYAAHRGSRLVVQPSAMVTGDPQRGWPHYFHGAAAHNLVQIDGRRQRPPSRVRPGAIPRLFESTRVRNALRSSGLAEPVARLRRRWGWDHLPPRLRSTAAGGAVLGHAIAADHAWVTATHATIAGADHVRTVVRLGSHAFLVDDRVDGAHRQIRQTWHFTPDADVALDDRRGLVKRQGTVVAVFRQLGDGAPVALRGVESPERAGWYGDNRGEPTPCWVVRYEADAPSARLVWVFQAGAEQLEADRVDEGRYRVKATDGTYEVRIDDDGVIVGRP